MAHRATVADRGAWRNAAPSFNSAFAIGAATTAALAFFLAQSFARLGDIFAVLQPFRLGILSQFALLIALVQLRAHTHLLSAGQHWTTKAVLVLAVLGVITAPTGAWPTASVQFYTNVYVTSLLVFVATGIAFAYPQTRKVILATVIILASVAAGRPVLGDFQGRYEIGWTYDANVTAAYLVMLVPWAAAWAATEVERKWKWVPLVALPLFIMGIARTGSRGGILGLFLAIPFLLSIAPPRRRTQLVAVVGLVGVLFAIYARKELSSTVDAITNDQDYNYTHVDGRVAVWKRGIKYFKESPLLGHGINGFQWRELAWKIKTFGGGKESAAHNMYIEVAVDLGAFGLVAFVVGCLGAIGDARGVRQRALQRFRATGERRDSDLAVFGGAAAASLLSLMVTGSFLSLAHQAPLFFAWGAAVGLALAERTRFAQQGGPMMPGVSAAGPVLPQVGARGWRSRHSAMRWKLNRG
jgi:O-antigen ligase